jgi:hypothetical protein
LWPPIQPLSEPFRYFMILINASTRWSHVCLLSTCNHVFAKFMTQVIRLKMNYPEYRIKSICMNNVVEFSSRVFNDYCMTQEIKVQYFFICSYTKWFDRISDRESSSSLDHYYKTVIYPHLIRVI